ncbi:adenine nucleotide translocase lysine N-methyltransferase [Aulostomus maculatus]
MLSEKETKNIRRFVCRQLGDCPDLSTLTFGILKKRYLTHTGHELLSPTAKSFMKQVVEEELMKMQASDENGSEVETKIPRNKRRREKEAAGSESDGEVESRSKKSRRVSSSSSESEDKEDCKSESRESEDEEQIKSESEDEEQEVTKSPKRMNGKKDQQVKCEESADEKINGEIKAERHEDESESDKSDRGNGSKSCSDSEKEETVSLRKEMSESDSDSSSSDDEKHHKPQKKEKKEKKKDNGAKGQRAGNKSLVRFKRYIALCGVKRNYKKLLAGCRSVPAMVAVLKKELESLGVEGKPTIEKCKKVRKKREEDQELAGLDVTNIIPTPGRPKRRVASAQQEQRDPPSSTYQRSLNSGSDSDQEHKTHGVRRRATHWANLQGIISDDADKMDEDTPDEAFAELKTRELGGWDVAQIAAGTGLAVYAMWVGILQPGFRKVPLRLQVPYIPASKAQVHNVMTLLRGRQGCLVDLGSGDGRIVLEAHRQGFTPAVGYELNPWLVRMARFHAWRAGHHGKVSYQREDLWKVDLTECKNITVFLAPSVLSLLQEKFQAELPDDALVVAGRFPLPDWTPCRTEGQGVDRAWAYRVREQRQHTQAKNKKFTVVEGDLSKQTTENQKEST